MMSHALTFPFWLITQRRGPDSVPVFVGSSAGYIACFRSAVDATEYMIGRGETAWEFRLVSRPELPALVKELRAVGAMGLILDPGAAAIRVRLDELQR